MEIKPINSVKINSPEIISTIDIPVTQGAETPVIRGLAIPIINYPNPAIKYPVIDVPTQEEFDAAVKAEQKEKESPIWFKEEKIYKRCDFSSDDWSSNGRCFRLIVLENMT